MFLPKSPSKHHQNTHETAQVCPKMWGVTELFSTKNKEMVIDGPLNFPYVPGPFSGIS
jgi:hypothetical protein